MKRPKQKSASAANGRATLTLVRTTTNTHRCTLQPPDFTPIHTATVLGEPKPFVIYGVEILDALEAAGQRILDEKGNWIGVLAEAGRVIHHECKSHQEVFEIVKTLRQNGGHP